MHFSARPEKKETAAWVIVLIVFMVLLFIGCVVVVFMCMKGYRCTKGGKNTKASAKYKNDGKNNGNVGFSSISEDPPASHEYASTYSPTTRGAVNMNYDNSAAGNNSYVSYNNDQSSADKYTPDDHKSESV